jgi:hypothetical protein
VSGPLKSAGVEAALVEWYPQEPGTNDASDMYAFEALGVRILIRQRKLSEAYTDTYINIQAPEGCAVEVNEGGENDYR